MENIKHQIVPVNGIKLHIAEIGEGPAVLLLHGFPELWYSWRNQLVYLASKGYRAIAPDLRGYGDSDAPAGVRKYTVFHIVGDLVALLDKLNLDKIFLVGHDWGAIIAWYFCWFRPDRIKALVNFSVPLHAVDPRDPAKEPVEEMREMFGDDYYIVRFQTKEVEEEFAKVDLALFLKAFLLTRATGPLLLPKGAVATLAENAKTMPFPDWLTQEDVDYYAEKESKNGLTGGINYYRNIDLNWELTQPWQRLKIELPVKFVVGDHDLTYTLIQDYIQNGSFKRDVPGLEDVVIVKGAHHFITQERADECNTQIYDFICKF